MNRRSFLKSVLGLGAALCLWPKEILLSRAPIVSAPRATLTLSEMGALLKRYYLKPIREQLNFASPLYQALSNVEEAAGELRIGVSARESRRIA